MHEDKHTTQTRKQVLKYNNKNTDSIQQSVIHHQYFYHNDKNTDSIQQSVIHHQYL